MNRPAFILFLVWIMMPLVGMGTDLYTPSFPPLVRDLHTTTQLVQLTVTTYFIGFTLGQFFLGPLSDRTGRRTVVLTGIPFLIVASFLCAISTNITSLLTFRFLQGLGIASVGMTARAICVDSFKGERLAGALSFFASAWGIGPLIGPLIGGILQTHFGWHANFYFFSICGLAIFPIIFFFFKETLRSPLPFRPSLVLKNYGILLTDKAFMGGTLSAASIAAMLVLYSVVTPFFIQDILGYSPLVFGYISSVLCASFVIGNLINRIILNFSSTTKTIYLGSVGMLLMSIVMILLTSLLPPNLYALMVPLALFFIFSGCVFPNVGKLALGAFSAMGGTASGLSGMLIMGASGLAALLGSLLETKTALPLSLFLFVMVLFAYFFFRLGKRHAP